MKLFVAILMLLSAGSGHCQVAPSSIRDESQRVMAYLGVLSAWQQQLSIVLLQCKKADPLGTAARQAVYEEWKSRKQEQLDRVDQYMKDIASVMLPPRPGVDPIRALNAATTLEISMQLQALPEDELRGLCASFKDLPSRLERNVGPHVTEAFSALDRWKESREQP
ncbi:hypothetical protein AACH06_29770 [Ideonella sp. DXS29W]|uniref:DUF2059 domain-containing protein n=1 Tax=Ideonella lacteola TaxID=2984193 RepID=A0ABU9C1U1_9BURK